MYRSHWGLRDSAFRNGLDPRRYFPAAGHEEVLARLHFLVEHRWRLGLLSGDAGTGKSFVLQIFAESLRRRGMAVAQVNLRGIDPHEFLWRLAASVGLNPDAGVTPFELWQQLDDQLTAFRYQQRTTVVIFDSFDAAAPGVLALVSRLAHTEELPGLRLSLVIAGREHQRAQLSRDLLQVVDLRIDLSPWTDAETTQYTQQALLRAGSSQPIFTESGLARLYELSHGIPRRVNQLAELALLAGAGQELDSIDAETVESVFLELSVSEVAA